MNATSRRPFAAMLYAAMLTALLAGCGDQAGGMRAGASSTADEDIYAIRCISIRGETRFSQAKTLSDALRKVNGVRADAVQVFDEDGVSTVYYGRYGRSYDEKTGNESFRPSPLKDLDFVRSLSLNLDGQAVWPFVGATMAALPGQASKFAQWELTNAKGYYSLQIAVFYNTADMKNRKQAAEEYCRLLRQQGEEAWFHHGELNSCVFVGSFPKAAIQTFRRENQYSGRVEFSEKIVDEKMLALQKRFPHNTHNGVIFYEVSTDARTGEKKREAHTSFAVVVPRPNSTR